MILSPNEVHLWMSRERAVEEPALEALSAVLEPHELEALERRANPELRSRYLRTRALQRVVLASYLSAVAPDQLRFVKGEHGKPSLAPEFDAAGISFNLSHTEGMVVLAVSRLRDVGVDVENLYERTTALKLARKYFTAEEARNLEALPPERQPERFYALWTLKESWMKATGRGLAAGTDNAAFSLDANHHVEGLAFAAYDATDWRFWQFTPTPEHTIALALRAPKQVRDAIATTHDWVPGTTPR